MSRDIPTAVSRFTITQRSVAKPAVASQPADVDVLGLTPNVNVCRCRPRQALGRRKESTVYPNASSVDDLSERVVVIRLNGDLSLVIVRMTAERADPLRKL